MNSVKNAKKRGKPFAPGNPGRPSGAQNKFTTLKDSFLGVFERLGGTDGLLEWAKKNKRNQAEFYRMVTKMLPANVSADVKLQVDLGYEQARKVEADLAKEKPVDPK